MDYFKRIELGKMLLKGFLGHSHRSMSLDRYGDRFSTDVLWKEVINKIYFDDVKMGRFEN